MSPIEYLLLFVVVVGGGTLAFRFSDRAQYALKLALSFSGAYILGMTIMHLMPGVFEQGGHGASFWILSGFFTQLVLEQLSRGVEHGHIHVHKHERRNFAVQVMLGLSLHAFLEGLPLTHFEEFHAAHHHHEEGEFQLLLGILLHKLPAAFALVALLLRSGFSYKIVWGCLIVFASMSPLGALSASYVPFTGPQIAKLLAFVIGSFLHISTTILFEADDTHQHRVSWRKLIVILLGMGLALLADTI